MALLKDFVVFLLVIFRYIGSAPRHVFVAVLVLTTLEAVAVRT